MDEFQSMKFNLSLTHFNLWLLKSNLKRHYFTHQSVTLITENQFFQHVVCEFEPPSDTFHSSINISQTRMNPSRPIPYWCYNQLQFSWAPLKKHVFCPPSPHSMLSELNEVLLESPHEMSCYYLPTTLMQGGGEEEARWRILYFSEGSN